MTVKVYYSTFNKRNLLITLENESQLFAFDTDEGAHYICARKDEEVIKLGFFQNAAERDSELKKLHRGFSGVPTIGNGSA